jgi:hypothetical protein
VLCASVLVKSGLENRDYARRGSAALFTLLHGNHSLYIIYLRYVCFCHWTDKLYTPSVMGTKVSPAVSYIDCYITIGKFLNSLSNILLVFIPGRKFVRSYTGFSSIWLPVHVVMYPDLQSRWTSPPQNFLLLLILVRAHGSAVVNALCFKPEGRGFDTRWGEFLNLPNPSCRTSPWGLLSL